MNLATCIIKIKQISFEDALGFLTLVTGLVIVTAVQVTVILPAVKMLSGAP